MLFKVPQDGFSCQISKPTLGRLEASTWQAVGHNSQNELGEVQSKTGMVQPIDWKRQFAPSPKLRGIIFISKVYQRWVLAKGRLRKTVSIAL